MNPWFGKLAVLVCLIAYCIIRAPHGRRSPSIPIKEDRKGVLEIVLLIGAWLGTTILPLIWVITGWPAGAEYPLRPIPYALGVVLMIAGLWLFHRSHTDLGTNWSVTLQTREGHRLVTTGVYERIRHPMYSSMFLLALAHLFFVPNVIVAPTYLLTFGVLYFLRVEHEERLMLDLFGAEYEAYMQRTGRLIPR